MPPVDLFPLLLPVTLVIIGALVTLAFEPFLQREAKHGLLPWLGAGFLIAAGVAQIFAEPGQLHGILAMDVPRMWMCGAIIASTLLAMGGLQQSLARDAYPGGEAYALSLFGASGAMLLVMSSDTLAQFLSLELMSLSVYAMVGLRRNRLESNEALFKYLIMGAVFGAIFIYGAALSYGATGTTALGHLWLDGDHRALFFFGQVLMMIALLFKVGAVPFHFWVPDAYTGAPVAVTGYMGAVVKVAGFAALGALWLNMITVAGGHAAGVLDLGSSVLVDYGSRGLLTRAGTAVLVLGSLSIALGNFSALRQTSVRRIIAYSSIAHAGYMLLAFALPAGDHIRLGSLWFYLISYAIATAGALAALAALAGREDGNDSLSGLAGQGRVQPFYGMVLTVFMVSIAGIPPTAGFLGKYLIFQDLVIKGYLPVAAFAMLMAVVGATYYFKVVVTLWATTPKEAAKAGPPVLSRSVLLVMAAMTILLIAWPGPLMNGTTPAPANPGPGKNASIGPEALGSEAHNPSGTTPVRGRPAVLSGAVQTHSPSPAAH